MKTRAPQLTRFVRFGAILAETLEYLDREVTFAEFGRRTGTSGPVVHREVGRLVDGEVLRDRQEGHNRLVRADAEHPLFALERDCLIAATYGRSRCFVSASRASAVSNGL